MIFRESVRPEESFDEKYQSLEAIREASAEDLADTESMNEKRRRQYMNFFTKTLFCDIFMTMGFLCGRSIFRRRGKQKSPEHKGEKGMNGTNGVSVSKVAQIMDLYNFLPDMDLKNTVLKSVM